MLPKNLAAIVAADQQGAMVAAWQILRDIGVRDLRSARDGAEALTLATERRPHFILLDLALEHDAVVALHCFRRTDAEQLRKLPIVALTAQATRVGIAALRDAGAHEILLKPVTGDKLVGRIRAMLLTPRPFIDAAAYAGPDRRRSTGEGYAGPFRRATDGDADDVFEVA